MIRILIVDDSENKRKKIKNAILDNHDISIDDITEAHNIKQGRKILYKEKFDLMILDLVLPLEDLSECNPTNGVKFLNEIYINPSITPPIHIIGITGYIEEVQNYKEDFQEKLWNLIPYEESSSDWEDRLKTIIFHLLRVRKNFIQSSIPNQLHSISQFIEQSELPNTIIGINWYEISKNIADIIERSLEVSKKFSNGPKAKCVNVDSIKIHSEYDFQNLIHLILRPWIPSTEAENIAVIFDGNTKNADFSIKGNSLIIEAKYIDTTGKKNDVLKTLEGLKNFYRKNANVKALLFLILVDKSVDIDKYKIEENFSQSISIPNTIVKVIINTLK